MKKLQEILGLELWAQVEAALRGQGKDGRDLELAVANDGSFIPKAKFDSLNKEYQALRAELTAAQNDLAGLDDLQTEKNSLEQALAAAEEEMGQVSAQYEQDFNKLKLEYSLERALTAAGARNTKAVRALLNEAELSLGEDGLGGLDQQLAAVKDEAPYLFQSAAPLYTPQGGSEVPDPSQMSDAEYYRFINKKG